MSNSLASALSWPMILGLLTGLCNELGYFVVTGQRAALGIKLLDKSSISADYIRVGAMVLVLEGTSLILFVALAIGLRGLLERWDWLLYQAVQENVRWTWMIVSAGFVAPLFGLWIVRRSSVDSVTRTGDVFGAEWVYSLAQLTATLSLTVILSWWILIKLEISPAFKAICGAWATILIFLLLVAIATLYGNAAKFGMYPVVRFDTTEKIGTNVMRVLIGSDDKLYAVLLLPPLPAETAKGEPQSNTHEPRRTILYLPRTEVKGMIVLWEDQLPDIVKQSQSRQLSPAASTNAMPPDAY